LEMEKSQFVILLSGRIELSPYLVSSTILEYNLHEKDMAA